MSLEQQTAQQMMSALQMILGNKQLGDVAPAFQAGSTPGLLGQSAPVVLPDRQVPQAGLMGGAEQTVTADKMTAPQSNLDPIQESLKQSSLQDIDTPEKSNPLAGFFSNLDKGLQSPSQQIGLGLLGQIDSNLPIAGLLAMGLLNQQR